MQTAHSDWAEADSSWGTALGMFAGGQGDSLAISSGAACHILRILLLLEDDIY